MVNLKMYAEFYKIVQRVAVIALEVDSFIQMKC